MDVRLVKELQNVPLFEERQRINDPSGRMLGWIDDLGAVSIAYDVSGRPLARYDKAFNRTYDMSGRMISYGDILASFIYSQKVR